MKKSEAIKLLESEAWTKADAIRALEVIDFNNNPDELTIRRAISNFAGSELNKRQRLQAAQKGQVTKKNKEIEQIHQEYDAKLTQYKQELKQARERNEAENHNLASVNELKAEVRRLTAVNDELKKENTALKDELQNVTSVNKDLNAKLKKSNLINDQLKKDNKDLKNVVDAIKLKLAIEVNQLLKYEDSEIRKALIKLFKSTLG
ncbi:hypothetical protein [Chroococcidiopsis sp. TS-821]|uniref:hypothetical protein n=1 Tax=Chroococcidiopsis sp. TS-821 TaxID=1378066 RepID=UPI000CEE0E91|nr:hypothetical protein [Chroococcidiopsis sp. TS-821]PPS45924.1 hypothetical protein B1A85_06785 [Chroococcidiopsis sp. TS-821]